MPFLFRLRAVHAAKHLVRPSDALCEAAMLAEPNLSVRMSEVTAAVLRPLLKNLPERVVEYNRRYQLVREREGLSFHSSSIFPNATRRGGRGGTNRRTQSKRKKTDTCTTTHDQNTW